MKFAKFGLVAIALLATLAVGNARAQGGPAAGGETGLFNLVGGETLPAREWSVSWYVNNWDQYTASLPPLGPFGAYETMIVDRTRMSIGLAYGVAENFELAASVPYDFIYGNNTGHGGNWDGIVIRDKVDESGGGPIHLGAKWRIVNSERDGLQLGLYGGVYAPTKSENSNDLLQTGAWDFNGGLAFTAKWLTLDISYLLRDDRNNHKIADQIRTGIGIDVPATKNVDVLMELSHLRPKQYCDESPLCREAKEQTDATAGFRWYVNDRVALNAGLRANLTMALGNTGSGSHNPLGWVAGITYWPRKAPVTTEVEALGAGGKGKGAKKTPPPPPVVTVPVEGSTVATSTPSVAGTAEPNAKVSLTVDGNAAGDAMAGPSGAWSSMVGPLADGPHALTATQTAADSGLTSEPSPATHFTVAKPVAPVVPVVPEKKPDQVTTDTVHFDPGSARLTNIAKAVLDQVAIRMKSEGSATAVAIGYTDDHEKNADKLSLRRAEACRDYLVKRHGIAADRISVEAKGKSEPAAEGKSKDARKENRRAIIRVTVKGQ